MDNQEKTGIEQAAEDLFNFAIDREDVKWLIGRLPQSDTINRSTVEYELQILKLISVGWSISFYLESNPLKNPIMELFWKAVQEFSGGISETTALMIGQDIDYFQVLKDRLDMYVAAMGNSSEEKDPTEIIGPEFARICGAVDDMQVYMSGAKMFFVTTNRVKKYLETLEMI